MDRRAFLLATSTALLPLALGRRPLFAADAGRFGAPPISLSWDTVEARKAWTAELISAITLHKADLDRGNPEQFIPGYQQLDGDGQLRFWGELIVAMAYYESSWDPHSIYHEPASLGVDSVGLLQLSYEDQPNYPGMEPLDRKQRSLEDPLVNLRCGVRIMARLVSRDGVVARGTKKQSRGAARYWSVLREGPTHRLAQIRGRVRQRLGL